MFIACDVPRVLFVSSNSVLSFGAASVRQGQPKRVADQCNRDFTWCRCVVVLLRRKCTLFLPSVRNCLCTAAGYSSRKKGIGSGWSMCPIYCDMVRTAWVHACVCVCVQSLCKLTFAAKCLLSRQPSGIELEVNQCLRFRHFTGDINSHTLIWSCSNSGSFLVVMMKLVSIAFDLDGFGLAPSMPLPPFPDLLSYFSYTVFPATTVFGPFMTYSAHRKHLTPSSLVSFARKDCLLVYVVQQQLC